MEFFLREKMNETVVHEIAPVWDKDSRILILGTMPSPKSREAGFFYMHPRNRFWRVMPVIFGEKLSDSVKDRKDFLMRHKIAIWDVLASCKISGASDSSIKNAIPNDFSQIFSESKIRHVYCTGKTAFSFWKKFCAPVYEHKFGITCVCLPSTSPANAAWTFENLLKEYAVIKEFIN